MQAKDLIKWKWVSIILTKNPNTIRADRNNKKYQDEINELTDFVQGWIDDKLVRSDVKILVKVPEKEVEISAPAQLAKVKVKKTPDFVIVESLPSDRKLVNLQGYKGLYSSLETKKWYTNKVIDGALEIKEWATIELAKDYLNSLK